MANFAGYDVGYDWMAAGGMYPGMGDTIGLSATTPQSATAFVGDGGPAGGSHAGNEPLGNPIQGAVIFLVLVLGVMLIVHRFGREQSDFGNVKASAYNALIIGLLAVAVIPLIKMAFGTLAAIGIPGAGAVYTYTKGA